MRSRYDQASLLILDDGHGAREFDCLSCAHCQAVLRRQRFTVEGAWCSRCGDGICSACAREMQQNGGVCASWKERIDRALSRRAGS